MRRFVVCVLLFVSMSATAAPWTKGKGSQLTLKIDHPPQVQTPLQQIAFAEPTGPCAELLTDSLVADFAMSGADVIDRINFQRIMAEHKLNLGGAIDEKTAAKIGRLIGTGSLIFVKVHECNTYKTRETRNSVDGLGVSRTQVPTTRATMKASIQIVNLTTGRTSAARVIDVKASLSADEMEQSKLGKAKDVALSILKGAKKYDEHPPDEEVQTILFANAVDQVHRLLFAWTETKQFHFFDDDACALHVAFRLMQSGDREGAAVEAQKSLETCKATPSIAPATLARAHYNRGILDFVAEDYSAALVNLTEAARLQKDQIFTDAITACNRARIEALARGEAKPPAKTPSTEKGVSNTTEAALSAEERLRKLDDLRKKKLITEQEYARKRQEILSGL